MTDVQWFILLLASLTAYGVQIILFSGLAKKREMTKHNATVFTSLVDMLSFEWKCADEIVHTLLTSTNKDLVEALAYFCGEERGLKHYYFLLSAISSFQQAGITEERTVLYSRENLVHRAHMFKGLPIWVKEECEQTLLEYKNFKDDAVVMCPLSEDGEPKPIQAKDAGYPLYQIRKKVIGGPPDRKPKPKEEENYFPGNLMPA
jgi:hypothetical protein